MSAADTYEKSNKKGTGLNFIILLMRDSSLNMLPHFLSKLHPQEIVAYEKKKIGTFKIRGRSRPTEKRRSIMASKGERESERERDRERERKRERGRERERERKREREGGGMAGKRKICMKDG